MSGDYETVSGPMAELFTDSVSFIQHALVAYAFSEHGKFHLVIYDDEGWELFWFSMWEIRVIFTSFISLDLKLAQSIEN